MDSMDIGMQKETLPTNLYHSFALTKCRYH